MPALDPAWPGGRLGGACGVLRHYSSACAADRGVRVRVGWCGARGCGAVRAACGVRGACGSVLRLGCGVRYFPVVGRLAKTS